MSSIVFEKVSHTYPDRVYSLRDISLSIPDGRITVILGKSGSGKSTLLQLINAMVRPAEGKVRIFGSAINYSETNLLRRKIGYVVQDIGLFPHLTVADNISISQKIGNAVYRSVDEVMSMMALPLSYKKRYPYELSGGEQQRVGICRAIYSKPPVLLMDEPLGALDALTRSEIQQEILDLHRNEKQTIVIVTHDMREAVKLAHYIAVVHDGALQQFAEKDIVLQQPVNDHVRSLINASL